MLNDKLLKSILAFLNIIQRLSTVKYALKFIAKEEKKCKKNYKSDPLHDFQYFKRKICFYSKSKKNLFCSSVVYLSSDCIPRTEEK